MQAAQWRPARFRWFERSLGTSTSPCQIMTDAGSAYIKVINNPLGPHALVREWVGTSLARWFGLPTLDFAIMTIGPRDEIWLYNGTRAQAGPAFATRTVSGFPWGGEEKSLASLEDPGVISRLVVFDTWTRNPDRHPPGLAARRPNPDNVFLTREGVQSGRFRLLAIDHTECFVSTATGLTARIATMERIRDPDIYGLFPQFRRYLDTAGLQKSVARLRAFDRSIALDILNEIPREWELSHDAGAALGELLLQRAAFVARTIIGRLNSNHPRTQQSLF